MSWRESTSSDGRTYYWHTITRETRWTRPEDFNGPRAPSRPRQGERPSRPEADRQSRKPKKATSVRRSIRKVESKSDLRNGSARERNRESERPRDRESRRAPESDVRQPSRSRNNVAPPNSAPTNNTVDDQPRPNTARQRTTNSTPAPPVNQGQTRNSHSDDDTRNNTGRRSTRYSGPPPRYDQGRSRDTEEADPPLYDPAGSNLGVLSRREQETIAIVDRSVERGVKAIEALMTKGWGASVRIDLDRKGIKVKPEKICYICHNFIASEVHFGAYL